MPGTVPSASFWENMLLYRREPFYCLLNPAHLVRRLIMHRRLLMQMTKRNVELQHKGSALGIFWSVLSPLLTFAVYAFVFATIFQGRFGKMPSETPVDYVIGIFLGLTLLQLFVESMVGAPLIIVQNANYVKKIVFPLEVLPAALFGAALFRCCISLGLVLLAVGIWGHGFSLEILWLPIILAGVSFLGLGVSWLFAALGVFLRDLAPVTQFFSVVLTFLSATVYSIDRIPQSFQFLKYNPLAVAVEISRDVVLWKVHLDISSLIFVLASGAALAIIGYAAFCSLRPAFADVL